MEKRGKRVFLSNTSEVGGTFGELKTRPKIRKFYPYIGLKKFVAIQRSENFESLHKYIQWCFDSIYILVGQNKFYNIDDNCYELIIQFLFAIAEFNGKLNFSLEKKHSPFLLDLVSFQYKLKYQICPSKHIVRAECMWLNHENVIIFNEQLIKNLLTKSVLANTEISVDQELEKTAVESLNENYTASDIVVLEKDVIKKLAILFTIAEHFAMHVFDDHNDFIQHKDFLKSTLTCIPTTITITPRGDFGSIQKIISDNTLFRI